jgi:hypothetical protein
MCILLVFYLIVLDVCVCAVSVASKDPVKLTNSRRVQHFFFLPVTPSSSGQHRIGVHIHTYTLECGCLWISVLGSRPFVIDSEESWCGLVTGESATPTPTVAQITVSLVRLCLSLICLHLCVTDIVQSHNAPHAPKSLCILLMTKFHIFVLFWDYFIFSMP